MSACLAGAAATPTPRRSSKPKTSPSGVSTSLGQPLPRPLRPPLAHSQTRQVLKQGVRQLDRQQGAALDRPLGRWCPARQSRLRSMQQRSRRSRQQPVEQPRWRQVQLSRQHSRRQVARPLLWGVQLLMAPSHCQPRPLQLHSQTLERQQACLSRLEPLRQAAQQQPPQAAVQAAAQHRGAQGVAQGQGLWQVRLAAGPWCSSSQRGSWCRWWCQRGRGRRQLAARRSSSSREV